MKIPALAACAALVLTAGCSSNPMQPGMWELTLTTKLDGHTQKLPVARECVTRKDVDDPIRTLPRPNGTCTLTNVDRQFGGKATYDIECKSDTQVMQGRAQVTYAEQRYEGTATLAVTQKGEQAPPMTVGISARRVGDCGT
ncbi:MAG: DUF3617 family protein [Burkholderiales bacterium]